MQHGKAEILRAKLQAEERERAKLSNELGEVREVLKRLKKDHARDLDKLRESLEAKVTFSTQEAKEAKEAKASVERVGLVGISG